MMRCRSPLIAFCLSSLKQQSAPLLATPLSRLFSTTVHLPDDEIERVTRDWFDRIVVGWNLCPFADRPNKEGKLKIEVVRGTDEQDILATVLGECIVRQELPGTTLVVAPECCPDSFEDYLSYCTTLEEDILPNHGLEQDLQIAPFHPLFEFADSTGVDVWTNRSPFPIFHILREEEVSAAVDKLDGDASKVWKRNVSLLQDLEDALGSEAELEKVVRNESHEHAETIRTSLQRHRFGVESTKKDS